MTFPPNYTGGAEYDLFVSSATSTTGTVTEPGGSPVAFSVTSGTVTSLAVTAVVPGGTVDGTVNEGVHVTAVAPVTIYGLNLMGGTSDAYTALPTDALGTRYRIASYTPLGSSLPSRLTVVGAVNGTTVTITPSVTTQGHAASTPFTESLNQGQVYTLANGSTDITGTLVTSDQPVAVYGSVDCADIDVGGNSGACDVLIQELPPTTSWGTDFLAVRLLKAANGDPFRVITDTNGTVVTVNGTVQGTINAGQYLDGVYGLPSGSNLNVGVHIQTSQPAMVIQYQTGGSYSQGSTTTSGDPSMMLVPPYQQFLASYTIATPPTQFIVNDVNVAIPTSATASLHLDGAAVSSSAFSPISGTSFSSAQLPLTLGSHTLTASLPFGVWVYGENASNSYAYPGGYSASSVATVASITPTLSVVQATAGSQVCMDVTVADASHNPLPGIRVDASVSGANTTTTFGVSDSSGVADVCYTGANPGTDAVGLSVGSVTATITVDQGSAQAPPEAPALTVVPGNDQLTLSWPQNPAGDNVTGYSYSLDGGTTWVAGTPTLTGSTESQTVSSLTNGQAYQVEVEATNGTGSTPSTEVDATPVAAQALPLTTPSPTPTSGPVPVATGGTPRPVRAAGPSPVPTGGAVAATPDGAGYWALAGGGQVTNRGDATNYGSENGTRLNGPVVAVNSTATGHGYWLAAADGSVLVFGDAHFYGSMVGKHLNRPIDGIATTPDGRGYWLVAADGGVFTFGDARFYGSLGKTGATPISGIVANANSGYRLVTPQGTAYPFGVIGQR